MIWYKKGKKPLLCLFNTLAGDLPEGDLLLEGDLLDVDILLKSNRFLDNDLL
jgi:hypothetical protein